MKVLEEIIAALKENAPVREVRVGPFWTAVWSRYCGLASTTFEHDHALESDSKNALELCEYAWRELAGRTLGWLHQLPGGRGFLLYGSVTV